MKLTILISLIFTLSSFVPKPSNKEYDIKEVYKEIIISSEIKTLNSSDELSDVKLLLEPVNLDYGKYSISVTRKSKNLYKVDGKNIYIETKYCYEYSYSDIVIIEIDSRSGFSKGKIIFM